MNIYDIIVKKRDGGKLNKVEISYFVDGYTNGTIPDYQASALLMAIYFNKMDKEETVALTQAMKASGDVIDLSPIKGIKVDKHSTGGVGDKTTLIVGPIAAACGVPIAKMSGRGLGFTGGTVDKMESIPGFRTSLKAEEFMELVNGSGISVIGQTGKIAPADKKIYALRDVTGTVEDLSLITSSIMSKKLASGSDGIVLDVKCGCGAFMESLEDAERLGNLMVEIGKADKKDTVAVITDMNQPLGRAVGNSLEVIEAIETLKGNGPKDITKLSETLAGIMIYLGKKSSTPEEGYEMARQALKDGRALEKFRSFVQGQGGNPDVIDNYNLFPAHKIIIEVISPETGFVSEVQAKKIGLASQRTGAGRAKKDDQVDLAAGIYINKKVGDAVLEGEVLATVYGNEKCKVEEGAREAEGAFSLSKKPPEEPKLVKKMIGLS